MQFLSEAECAEWCERHGYPKPDNLRDLGAPPGYSQHDFEIPAGAGPSNVTLQRRHAKP